jgi:fimbrial chaperone protein/chaperone protein EcpD
MNIRNISRFLPVTLLFSLCMAAAAPTTASVVIAGTRVVYHAKDQETTVKLSNAGTTPSLTQVWIDTGDASASPSDINVPFIVTPPVSRIDPGKAQTLRIVYTGEPLPADKESVFWLNVLDIPPKPESETGNTLQLVVRSRIKLFFRPANLPGAAQNAPEKVEWRVIRNNGQWALQAHNPTPYHVSFGWLEMDGKRLDDGGMVAPGETQSFPLKGEPVSTASATVKYHAISDYGGAIEGEAALQTN